MAHDTRSDEAVFGAEAPRPLVHDASAEDLGDDVKALAIVARSSGRASVVRRVDGVLVRVIVEAA